MKVYNDHRDELCDFVCGTQYICHQSQYYRILWNLNQPYQDSTPTPSEEGKESWMTHKASITQQSLLLRWKKRRDRAWSRGSMVYELRSDMCIVSDISMIKGDMISKPIIQNVPCAVYSIVLECLTCVVLCEPNLTLSKHQLKELEQLKIFFSFYLHFLCNIIYIKVAR